jgi:transposase-like protein
MKAQIVAQCRQPGVSVAGVALSHGINANVVRKWIRKAERPPEPAFVPIVPAGVPGAGRHIELHLTRGDAQATVRWPIHEAAACGSWLREWLR